ncbi:MAG: 16S rRNA (guanine(966)-N(2))-methyltransferase RsmD [Candidatus Acidiferrales bacterium]
MRVIAGKFKSRRLRALRGMELRPTSDRLRETLFDILGAAVEGCMFVDLFAGTGAVGIEAISRGARRVVFIERHAPAVQVIRENLKSLGITGEAEIFPMDAMRGLEKLASQHAPSDFVFLDPPYAQAEEYRRVLEFIGAAGMLSAMGTVIAEHGKKLELPPQVEALERTRVKVQGDSALSFYRVTRMA